jgi:hypothetical protein
MNGNNAADDILWLKNILQTACQSVGGAQPRDTTEKLPHDVKNKDNLLAI